MFAKLVLAASTALAIATMAAGFSAPAQAHDWDRGNAGYEQNYDRGHEGRRRGWNDDGDYGYRRPHHGWGWGWHRPRPHFAFAPPRPYWEAPRPWWQQPRHWNRGYDGER